MVVLKEHKSSLLIWLSLIIGELHTLFEQSSNTANWILNNKVVMTIQWNLKYAGDEVQGLLLALAILFFRRNKFNITTAKAFVFFYIIDTLFYFYNYKRDGYGWTYTLTLIAWILIYNHGNKSTDRQGNIIAA
jgi:hypothetical protein